MKAEYAGVKLRSKRIDRAIKRAQRAKPKKKSAAALVRAYKQQH